MTRIYQPKHLPDGTLNPKYKGRSGPSGKSGKHLSKFARGKFIAWDGEGITKADGSHIYAMLCTSTDDAPLINLDGLRTLDCLEMLCDIGERNKGAVHVAYVASYDVNMILCDVPRPLLEKIWSGQWTALGNYLVCYRSRKSFTVKRRPKRIKGQAPAPPSPGIVLWDVFGFFQDTFVGACEKYLGKEFPGLDEIRSQKLRRSIFSADEVADILHYCKLECATLVKLMNQLRDYLDQAQLPVRRWDGAGACAAALLQREGIRDHKATFLPDIQRAAQYAYAGGRMEVCRYGHTTDRPIYHYDINSAYPTAMCELPSLAKGKWRSTTGRRAAYRPEFPFALYRVSWDLADGEMYPFFWRGHDCSIYFPASGAGWYWSPEIKAALDAQAMGLFTGTITLHEAHYWEPADPDARPFAWLPPLYEQRKEWKRNNIGAEKVVKLAINSLYGKCAQHLGGTKDEPPRYHQLEWAGYITSATRAKLYSAALPALARRNIIMTATDALYSLEPLDVPTGSTLGEWEAHTHCGITVVQSGVYWTDNVLADGRKIADPFCRGFDRGSLDREKIIRAWKTGATKYEASLTRFVTMGSALQGKHSIEHWRRWRTVPRMLSLTSDGTKRVDEIDPSKWTKRNGPHATLIHTLAAVPASQVAGQTMSAPYPLPWVADDGVRPLDTTLDGVPLRIIETEAYDADA